MAVRGTGELEKTTATAPGSSGALDRGLLPGQVREIERQSAIDTYAALVLGNLAGWAVAQGLTDDEMEVELADRVRALVIVAINDERGKFQKSTARARERQHFVAETHDRCTAPTPAQR